MRMDLLDLCRWLCYTSAESARLHILLKASVHSKISEAVTTNPSLVVLALGGGQSATCPQSGLDNLDLTVRRCFELSPSPFTFAIPNLRFQAESLGGSL